MKRVREFLYESYDEDPFDDRYDPDEEDEDYEDEWSQDNNSDKEDLLEEVDSVERSIWLSHIQAAKDEWEEVSSNALEGRKYWAYLDNWTIERAIESGRDILRKYT